MSDTNTSHFIPFGLVNIINDHRPGPNYSDETHRQLDSILNSDYNTSETSAYWNQVTNRAAESEIEDLYLGNIT
jgi:hypothetical protein